ncbi:DNA internalization-related competence protein ComEC/Rec2 [Acidihalobacter prosperus]|uniref:DNA internalization-related competence protein ComEC/Rec2 n=1 Tax=Acidihalobacter prosperus TaxID=160660 RepID=A0A1A6C8I9_9GAMM|nr:DNA internalization-related competence protein ComEC/Rec2 [Acidihalobacter prosperus]OBS10871.1 DNA internalization-related competence protein ComEC/Rec2 [Acidihalobacter prosperus]
MSLTGALAFLLGILALGALPTLPSMFVWLPVALLLAVFWRVRRRCPSALAFACWFVLGFAWALTRADALLDQRWSADDMHRDVVLTGVVRGVPERQDHSTRFEFAVEAARLGDRLLTQPPARVRLGWYGRRPDLRPGERWRLTARLKPAHGHLNPGGFDYEGWLFSRGIRATGYVREGGKARRLGQASDPVSLVDRWRQTLDRRLHAALEGTPNAGVISALVLGMRSGIPEDRWRVLLETGTNHLIAISGLHIGLIAGLVFALVRRFWAFVPALALRLSAPQAAAGMALVAAALYALMAGLSIPTQRALVMLAVALGGIMLKRHLRPSHALALALVGVLLLDPFAVHNAGFWLSFSAVAFILYALIGRERPRRGGTWTHWLRVQWALTLGLLPLSIALFQRAAPVAPLANLIAVPWVGLLVVPLSLSGTLLLSVWPAGGAAVLRLASGLLNALWPLLDWLAELPWAHLRLGLSDIWVLPVALAGVLIVLAPRAWPARWVGLILVAPVFVPAGDTPRPGDWRLTLLDVGQGLAATVQTARHVLVFDAGPRYRSGFDAGEAIVAPYLRTQGVTHIDRLIVSHPDMDHRGGAASLAAALPVHMRIDAVGPNACRAGQSWHWDGIDFMFLYPAPGETGSRNNRSCVLKVSGPGGSALLIADIERGGERRLVNRGRRILASDLMLVPHHGSLTSSSSGLIDAVGPRIALISSGFGNRFGFPRAAVLQRYRARGVAVYDTASAGAIRVDFIADAQAGIEVKAYRHSHRRFWQYSAAEPAGAQNRIEPIGFGMFNNANNND